MAWWAPTDKLTSRRDGSPRANKMKLKQICKLGIHCVALAEWLSWLERHCTPKGCWFESWSGHLLSLQGPSMVGACIGGS